MDNTNIIMQLKGGSELQNVKYRIIRVLGQGGFGITYLAENTYFDKKVAIKEFFPKDFCGRDNSSHLTLWTQNNADLVEKLKARFLKEAKNIAKLDHPCIVKIHDIFEENNTAYYVMDYIEGENLNEMVKQDGPLSETKAVEYIKKVGEALVYIHSSNMTHFDVKPANIVIRKNDDSPVLIDFGLSKQYDKHGDATSTLMQGVSHGYSPIELYNPGSISSFSPQTDVYSLGATMYYLLTGCTPPSASEITQNGLSVPINISEVNAYSIRKAMSVSRVERPQNITSFLQFLSARTDTNEFENTASANANEDTIFVYPELEYGKNENSADSTKPIHTHSEKKSNIVRNWAIVIITCVIIVIACLLLNQNNENDPQLYDQLYERNPTIETTVPQIDDKNAKNTEKSTNTVIPQIEKTIENDNDINQIVNAFFKRNSWNCLENYNKYQVSDGMEVFDSDFGGYVVGYEIPLNINNQPLIKDETGKTQLWTICLYGPGAYVSAIEFNTFVLYGDLEEIAKKFANSINASVERKLKSDFGSSITLYNIRGKRLGICCLNGVHGGTIIALIGDKSEIDNWANQQL